MKLEDIFTKDELALIDAGEYRPGRKVLDAKLDLWAALEREACARVCEDEIKRVKPIYSVVAENVLKAIRARGQE